MKAVGVIGLGIMGSAMAASLLRSGFRVHGYDILAARRDALKKAGGIPCRSVSEVSSKAKIIITSLPSAAALHKVSRQLSGIVIETSTLPIEDKLKARDVLKRAKAILLDCPLSGTGAQARTGDLVVYGSGEKIIYEKALPILKGFSRAQYFVGEFGNGRRMKFVANLMVAIHNVSAAEAFALGAKSGLDRKRILKVIADGAGSSRMFQVRGPMMVAGDYTEVTMSNQLWQKDMKIIGEFAAQLGVATPLFNASAAIYNAAMAQGYAKQDTGAVCAVMEGLAGISRRKRG
jgi:3-hydroxyisobutyrate dehydrogenase-like beta-hydroxyacid dehydrogenase